MQRVVIHLCSPLLCQRSWLQRQLLKDGMILVTICVGIVSVQHQALTTSLSLGIVMKAELSYRLLVTLLFASEQQWGKSTTNTAHRSITYPISVTTPLALQLTPIRHDDQYNTLCVQASGSVTDGNLTPKMYASSASMWNEQNTAVYWLLIAL